VPLLGRLQLHWLVSGASLVAIGMVALATVLLYRKITSIEWISKLLLAGVLGIIFWIIVAGLRHFDAAQAFSFPPGAFTLSHNFFLGLGSAMLIATYDYWGYYNVAFLGDEQPRAVADRGAGAPKALIPNSAVSHQDGKTSVFLVHDGKVERRAVTLGSQRGDDVEVLAGLSEGDALVAKVPENLRDGQTVDVKK